MAWRRQARQDRSGGGEVGTIRRHRLLHMAVRHRSIMVGGVILLGLLCPVNADLVSRVLAAGRGCRPRLHAPLPCRDRGVNATPRYAPCVKRIAAPSCLPDSRWSPLDAVGCILSWHQGHFGIELTQVAQQSMSEHPSLWCGLKRTWQQHLHPPRRCGGIYPSLEDAR